MASQSSIKLTKLVERFELKVLNEGKNYDRCLIRADDINRPALQILGFFDYFAPDRIQVIGKVEWTYLSNQSSEERRKCFDAFFEKPIPALILTRSLEPFPELMEMAIKHKRTILGSKEDTSIFIPNFTDWLKARLSPGSPGTACWWTCTARACCSWATPAWVRARRLWSWSSAATGWSPTTRWRSATSAPASSVRPRS